MVLPLISPESGYVNTDSEIGSWDGRSTWNADEYDEIGACLHGAIVIESGSIN
jgi:hypothetical protein